MKTKPHISRGRFALLLALLLMACPSYQEAGEAEPAFEGKPATFWLGQLESPEVRTRLKASHALSKIRPLSQVAVPALIKALRDPNEHVRRNSAEALAHVGSAARPALVALIEALSDQEDADLRTYAAKALGSIGPEAHPAVPALTRTLSDKWFLVREKAAEALGGIGPKAGAAIPDLLSLLGDRNLYVRRAASRSLGLIGKKAIPGLLKALDSESPMVRSQVIRTLGFAGRGAAEAVPALQKCLADPRLAARAAEALYRIAPDNRDVRRKVADFVSEHKLDVPYPGYDDDLKLVTRRIEVEGPPAVFAAPEAVAAALRLFQSEAFIGKSRSEVTKILRGVPPVSAEDSKDVLQYAFDTGRTGFAVVLHFESGKVSRSEIRPGY